jgi:predicted chitinase
MRSTGAFYYGVVENRNDPLSLGRCQVRIAGLHTHDKSLLPTEDLPWSTPVSPITSAAMNGIGHAPLGPVEGTTVIVMFADGERLQQPIMFGSLGGIATTPIGIDADQTGQLDAAAAVTLSEVQIETADIEGGQTGNTLILQDYDTERTDLTSQLAPDMRVFGFNIPDDTRIVTIASNNSITISKEVSGYQRNILTFGPPPTNLQALEESQVFLDSISGQESVAATPRPSATNNEIPQIPPEGSTQNRSKASEGIRALLAACDQVGLTTKEQKCALLGIVGVESGWDPKEEYYNYSPESLQRTFSFATAADVETYARAPSKGLTKFDFFSWAYGPTKRGAGFLGNETDADGGNYFGRGFIQLTGKYNYARYARLAREAGLDADILTNPDLLNSDINVSAIIAALYLKDRVPDSVSPSSHPNYFMAAKRAVGGAASGFARKQEYYNYFYGVAQNEVYRDAEPPVIPAPEGSFDGTPQPSQESYATGAGSLGFRDPNAKYPLPKFINEPDTNRLARGIIEGTIVELKDATRITGLKKPFGGTWSQPEVPFGAKYPFNHVSESESGHVHEIDDTPGSERIHEYHRSGTYREIDANGTQVNYIVGDNYILMERNGNIHVAGECNITAEGAVNIMVQSDANINVSQNANIEVGNNVNMDVNRDINMTAGGNMRVNVAGDYSLTAANIFNYTAGNMKSQADSGMHQQSGDFMYLASTSGMQIHDASQVNIESAGSFDLLAGGTMNADYAQGHFGEGATGAGIADTIGNGLETESRQDGDGNADWTFEVPDPGQPINRSFDPLLTPERRFELLSTHETPEEWDTVEGRYQSDQISRNNGVPNPPAASVDGSVDRPRGGGNQPIPVNCDVVFGTERFDNNFRLSEHFTLGMLFDGGVGGQHSLVAQNGLSVQQIVCNLAQLAQNILEPALAVLPGGIDGYRRQWRINSGYRQGTSSSQHNKGQAVDIGIIAGSLDEKIQTAYDLTLELDKTVPYDQLILEYRHGTSCWIHCSYNGESQRGMGFTMVNDSTYRRDSNGMPAGFYRLTSIPPKRG